MPFVETAVFGSSGAPVLPDAEFINHFNMIRMRVVGAGVLRSTMYSMDDISSEVLPTATLAATSQYVTELKSNFKSQRMTLRLETTAIDEVVRMSKILIFTKPLWSSIPG